ncbi:MAG: hypothetical protein F6J86_20680 [Symploca sp. SIO1B1]|nr:hypothetical protein [Symploca sp. SIO1B1]
MEVTQQLERDGYLIKIIFCPYIENYHWEVFNDNYLVETSREFGDGFDSEDECIKYASTFIRNYRDDNGFS